MTNAFQDCRSWIGLSETVDDMVGAGPARALAATLDRAPPPAEPGSTLPPLWHWLYGLPLHLQSLLGPDGHALRGGFLPPVPLPRRMWAGGRFAFHAPIRIGETFSRTSTIEDVREANGRSGALVFITVRHELRCGGASAPALVEHHDIVYREAAHAGLAAAAPTATPADAAWRRTLVPDPVLLFRYSALTFNGHRIHYDRPWATEAEGYPGLVVHGPLIATLLLDLLHRERPDAELVAFRFKALRPVFDGRPLHLHGQPAPDGRSVQLWAGDHEGTLAMDATATLR